ncbi:MAG TPA: helix-turn-helix domain-containing protein [Dehalococcoidia bacterium]|nr:helix-turn-helix domain-containing protein [Dehalococcoidia bacterium]
MSSNTKRIKRHRSDGKSIMTCDEVAEYLRVHVSSVRRWSRCGKLTAFKVGGRGDWRYRKQDVLAFLYDVNVTNPKGQGQREVMGMLKT